MYRAYIKGISKELQMLNYRMDWLKGVNTVATWSNEITANKHQMLSAADFIATEYASMFKLRFSYAKYVIYSQCK